MPSHPSHSRSIREQARPATAWPSPQPLSPQQNRSQSQYSVPGFQRPHKHENLEEAPKYTAPASFQVSHLPSIPLLCAQRHSSTRLLIRDDRGDDLDNATTLYFYRPTP